MSEAITTAARVAELPDNQRLAIQALLKGWTHSRVADEAGVAERTVRHWLRDPVFLAALRQARCDHWTVLTSHLQQASVLAVDTLVELMRHAESERVRTQACRTVLQYASRALDLEALAVRVTQLEHDLEASLQSAAAADHAPEAGVSDSPADDADSSADPRASGGRLAGGPSARYFSAWPPAAAVPEAVVSPRQGGQKPAHSGKNRQKPAMTPATRDSGPGTQDPGLRTPDRNRPPFMPGNRGI